MSARRALYKSIYDIPCRSVPKYITERTSDIGRNRAGVAQGVDLIESDQSYGTLRVLSKPPWESAEKHKPGWNTRWRA
jgi:hypothetical protein